MALQVVRRLWTPAGPTVWCVRAMFTCFGKGVCTHRGRGVWGGHGIDLSPFLFRVSPTHLAVPLTLIRTETHHDNFAEARLKGSIFSRPKKIECRRRQPFKLACGVSCQRRTHGAAHPPPLHLRACCSHKSCANRMCAFCGSRLSTTSFRNNHSTVTRSTVVPSDHTFSPTTHR